MQSLNQPISGQRGIIRGALGFIVLMRLRYVRRPRLATPA